MKWHWVDAEVSIGTEDVGVGADRLGVSVEIRLDVVDRSVQAPVGGWCVAQARGPPGVDARVCANGGVAGGWRWLVWDYGPVGMSLPSRLSK